MKNILIKLSQKIENSITQSLFQVADYVRLSIRYKNEKKIYLN